VDVPKEEWRTQYLAKQKWPRSRNASISVRR
jgi:hypothetical protein